MNYREIAILEETRQAEGTAEIASESEHIAGGWMAFAGMGSWANQACGIGMAGPVSDDDLDRLVDFYVQRGVEPRLEVCPFVDETLITGLAKRGFELREFENVMFRTVAADDDLRSLLEHGWPPGLELVPVDAHDEGQTRTFIDVATSGFRPAGEPVSDIFFQVSHNTVAHPRSSHYLALIDGVPAGGGGMETTAAVACLFGTSVLPEFQRRGIQAALIARRLERARELGCPLVTIHTRPGIATERNARRLGFEMAYTKLIMAMPGEGLAVSP
ncbi:Acetyltransferase (GNAT) family protein [Symmachiella dynata]|uniref:Acetyltransferase (GNAT) family protein n=1 Tax=Symmachiella dynata TaxID=2527995 RepID=A0A517ZU27_9PLAN|nr:GNAT family N-acetyltransferase [Symmachiella dynata]QDU45964.1 Acetyltransferase (GNAT) family protein [Symmachiella dynata]